MVFKKITARPDCYENLIIARDTQKVAWYTFQIL